MLGIGEVEVLGLLVLVGISFAATNLDNLVLLVVLLGIAQGNRAAAILGFVIAMIGVLCVAAIGTVIGANIDPGLVGYLGFVPLLLGAWMLLRQLRGVSSVAETNSPQPQRSGVLGSFLLMFANSGDSIAVFLPLLAESSRESLLWEVSMFLMMALLWAGLAWRIADQPQLAKHIERVGEKLMPWIIMAVGVYILLDTGTDIYVPPSEL